MMSIFRIQISAAWQVTIIESLLWVTATGKLGKEVENVWINFPIGFNIITPVFVKITTKIPKYTMSTALSSCRILVQSPLFKSTR
jgi:hypothetical protein